MKLPLSLNGSTSSTIILLASLASVTVLTWHGSVDAQAFVAIVSAVLAGVVHERVRHTTHGSEPSQTPPPAD